MTIKRKKVDRRIFPMLSIVFGLSLVDRTNISAAYVAGLGQDLHLNIGVRYNLSLVIFCLGMSNNRPFEEAQLINRKRTLYSTCHRTSSFAV